MLPGKEIRLAHYGVNEESAVALAAALLANKSVTLLDLQDNWIGEKGAAALAFALTSHNKSIERLDLSRNSLGMFGAFSIAGIFVHNNSITELCLCRTQFNNKHTEALAAALAGNNKLAKLDLSANNIGAVRDTPFSSQLYHHSSHMSNFVRWAARRWRRC
jgi:Ran GTPase-activating protein (RanGAP) involved in mRNA processing and transport